MGGAPDPDARAPAPTGVAPTPAAAILNINDEATLVRYVWASSLNLRESSDPSSAVLGLLDVNTPLAVVEGGETTAMVKVRVGNGKEGWVAGAYLHDEPLSVAEVERQLAAATDAKERLSWLERAVALQPGDYGAMTALRDAYAAAGMSEELAWIEGRMAWPPNIRVSPDFSRDPITVEWKTGAWEHYVPLLPGEEWPWQIPLDETQMAAFDLRPTDTWWVLPDAGPAVVARTAHVYSRLLNDCGGDVGLVVELDAVLPPDRVPVAIAHGEPPAHWKEAGVVPTLGREHALARVRAKARDLGAPETVDVGVAANGEGWTGRAVWSRNEEDTEWWDPDTMTLSVAIDASGRVEVESLAETSGQFPPFPVSVRDVKGDGSPQVIWDDRCSGRIEVDGRELTSSTFRCCGC